MRIEHLERRADRPEELVSIVVRAAREECADGECLIHPVLEACAAEAVNRYWQSRIHAFVPLLALREVRDCIRAGGCPDQVDSTGGRGYQV
jgi:hypothetical protein